MKTNTIFFFLMMMLVIVTALGMVNAKHQSRKLFVELQELESLRDELIVEWGRLQLEEGTWAAHGRVDNIARSQLGMFIPMPEKIIFVEEQ
jgi:cell division protein FtsL